MSKIKFGDGQYVVYAPNEHEARLIIGQELARFDQIKYLMSQLLVENGQAWQNFMINSSEDRLNIHFNDEKSLIYDKDSTSKGRVRKERPNDENGYYSYDLAYRYPEIQGHDANFRLAHEMGHLMLNPSSQKRQTYDKTTNTTQVSGLIRVPKGQEFNTKTFYGEEMQENAINLLAQLAIRGEHSADDIIFGKVDLSEFNLYKKCDDLVKLLVVSMRNDFDNEISFEQLVTQKIDSIIEHSDGTQEPANMFFYGILNDSSIIQKEFDKYMGKGAWIELNLAFKQLHKPDIEKDRFNTIFEAAQGLIKEFANVRMQDKYKEVAQKNGEIIRQNQENEVKKQEQSQNKLSLKQKVAKFLRSHDIFMNLTFVENFVNKQLNILPERTETKQSAQIAKNRLKKDFENWLSNNGEYKNLPPVHSVSNPDSIARMQRKMNTKRDGR